MDMMYTSVNSYIKTMSMQMKWENKTRTGNYTAKEKEPEETASEWAEKQKRIINGQDPDTGKKPEDKTMNSINNKLNSGRKLTIAEKQYLQRKDPRKYQKLVDTENAQADYERKLKRCRTKDEVRRLKMIYAASSLGTVNSVKNNPHIPHEKKQEIIAGERQKNAAFERVDKEFLKSGEYSALPTEAERFTAMKKLARAKRNEQENRPGEAEKKVEKKKPHTDKDGKKTCKTETKTVRVKEKKYRIKRGITTAEAENSCEMRKVKRAEKKGGLGSGGTALFSAEVTIKSLDARA